MVELVYSWVVGKWRKEQKWEEAWRLSIGASQLETILLDELGYESGSEGEGKAADKGKVNSVWMVDEIR